MTHTLNAYPNLRDGTPAPLLPSDVEALVDADIEHIVSMHGADSREPNKTLFPASWTAEKIQAVVEAVLWSRHGVFSRSLHRTPAGVVIRAMVEGVVLELPLDELTHSWVMMTAYPICGDGVYRNTSDGKREPVPLNIGALFRTLDL